MEKKNSSNTVQLLAVILILIVAMAFVGYRFVISPLQAEKKTKEEENYQLKVRKIELQNLTTQENFFKDEIEKSRLALNTAMEKFSGGNTPEKSIMLVKKMEDDIKVEIPTITFSDPSVITSVHMPKIKENENGTYDIEYFDVSVTKETITYSYTCDYYQLKDLNDFINYNREVMNLDSITASYDTERGLISGVIVQNLYAAVGGDKKYEEPDIRDIRLGEHNIFSK